MRESSKNAALEVAGRFERLRGSLNERARRLFAATEALAFGHGGITMVAVATGMAPATIGKGIKELRQLESGWTPPWGTARIRRPGAGRRKSAERDPALPTYARSWRAPRGGTRKRRCCGRRAACGICSENSRSWATRRARTS